MLASVLGLRGSALASVLALRGSALASVLESALAPVSAAKAYWVWTQEAAPAAKACSESALELSELGPGVEIIHRPDRPVEEYSALGSDYWASDYWALAQALDCSASASVLESARSASVLDHSGY